MWSEKKLSNYTSWLVFFIALIVYYFSVERTGSLWDCGEFILGAYKLQVVHPPGAPLFVLIGSVFAHFGDLVSNNPADIAFAVNFMSGLFSALTALLVAKTTMILGRKMILAPDEDSSVAHRIAVNGAGLVAGLTTAFSTSIWFSAVEGEVYAMSTFFTALTVWASFKWYSLPDTRDADRWLLFAIFMGGLSIGVHLLSILSFPILTLLYYYKKYKKHTYQGILLSLFVGVFMMYFTLKIVIAGIPWLWTKFELMMVNGLGLPFHTGLIPLVILIAAIFYFAFRYAERKKSYLLHLTTISAMLIVIGFSLIGVVVIRANADTPINMNVPSDAFRLLPYLNREQYGERPLLYGPYFDSKPVDYEREERYGRVGDRYEIVDEKITPIYDSSDNMLFPRLGATDQGRPALYRAWLNKRSGKPSMGDNIRFFIQYQIGWMYWRYFMWNFAGRQNGEQGFFDSDVSVGNWESGVKFIDEARLHEMDELPDTWKNDPAKNHYYLLPFLFGLLGMFYHASRNKKYFFALFSLFLITGIGIIVYSNQPPNEPRERDYVLVGSFFTFAMWIGLSIPALFELLKDKIRVNRPLLAGLSLLVVLSAPLLMGFENFDDHSRKEHYGSRDYAANFLNSCDENAIIFTYGDNDTYPLWYAQEVEGIRRDVRVVNLSLIAVDWYINKLRNKVNDSPPIKLSISEDAIRGNKRNHLPFYNSPIEKLQQSMELSAVLRFMGEDHKLPTRSLTFESFIPAQKMHITVDKERAIRSGWINEADSARIVDRININFNSSYLTKDEIAILDIINSNIYERPIYFAVTTKNEKLMGLNDYTQLEGLGLRIIPVKSRSNKSMQIFGSGRTASEKIYDNVMNRWRWGNFDKFDTHINTSYGAEINAMKMAMNRASRDLANKGDKEKAVALSKKYFEAFPHFNFPYDYSILPFVEILINEEEYEDAKKHMRILAEESYQQMNFFLSLDDEDIDSFEKQIQIAQVSINGILRNAGEVKDDNFKQEMEALIGEFDYSQIAD
jgi:hypothetical protein